ncbi:6-pyruvoyl trahydropterin synthase family protein [Glycocaulis sp.]|uniref:6-pyruvoyl trahydropterin synthase family protein n=1 Tax=Glycocaulis sp. TaxID=1969725 RepID=UPI003D262BCE
MMLISAQVNIEAAHFTPFGAEDDARRQIHGHSYLVRAWVQAEPGVEDLDRLREDLSTAAAPLDHALLNEVEGLAGPSMEAIADFVAQRLTPLWPGLRKVSVARPTLGYEVVRELV